LQAGTEACPTVLKKAFGGAASLAARANCIPLSHFHKNEEPGNFDILRSIISFRMTKKADF
jgi:hypothetical protein